MGWMNELRRAVRARIKELGPGSSIEEEEEALRKAAGEGHLETVRFFSEERSVDVSAKNARGRTALMKAAETGHPDIVLYLAEERGADVDAKDVKGVTALMMAASYGDHIKASMLKTVPMERIVAAGRGAWKSFRCLAEQDANVNDKDKHGHTALMKAAAIGRANVVQYLAEKCNADIEAKDNNGVTALMMASEHGHAQVVRRHCEQGVDVDAKDKRGCTTLSWAANWGRLEVVQLVVKHGGDVNARDEDGLTALMRATLTDRLKLFDTLRKITALSKCPEQVGKNGGAACGRSSCFRDSTGSHASAFHSNSTTEHCIITGIAPYQTTTSTKS